MLLSRSALHSSNLIGNTQWKKCQSVILLTSSEGNTELAENLGSCLYKVGSQAQIKTKYAGILIYAQHV